VYTFAEAAERQADFSPPDLCCGTSDFACYAKPKVGLYQPLSRVRARGTAVPTVLDLKVVDFQRVSRTPCLVFGALRGCVRDWVIRMWHSAFRGLRCVERWVFSTCLA
jgi:hypothetical protein